MMKRETSYTTINPTLLLQEKTDLITAGNSKRVHFN